MSFADRLAGLRREKGLSQRQVALELGISQALLSHYENGQREPRLEFVAVICDYYAVSADYLLGRTENTDEARELARLQRCEADLRSLTARLNALNDYANTITQG